MFPQLAGLVGGAVFPGGEVAARPGRGARGEGGLPGVRRLSRRVPSRYQRRLAELAAGGQEPLIHLQVRRFFCGNGACARPRSPNRSGPDHPLRAPRTAAWTGRWRRSRWPSAAARARLSGRLACPASRSTLLRLIRACPTATARVVLGVDDFALRTRACLRHVLVDIGPPPVDMLPERSAESFAAGSVPRPG